ncbi:MFS transporter [Desulfoplanes sp.]
MWTQLSDQVQKARKYSDTWYAGYAFQGAVVLGIAPILIPMVVGKTLDAVAAGTVVAAMYGGQLCAPVLGSLTDKTGRYHIAYLSGYLLLALGLGLFGLTESLRVWTILAFIVGMGSAVTNTVSAMFIVENKPRSEWDERIGWLQTLYGTGQAIGLGLVAMLMGSPRFGLMVAALLMVPGAILGRMHLPPDHERPAGHPKQRFERRRHRPARGSFSILHTYEQNLPHHLSEITAVVKTPFAMYIVAWFCIMFSNWIIYNLYPLLMSSVYHIDGSQSSLYYAIGAGFGIFAYAPSGTLGEKIGDGRVVMIGALMSLVSLAALCFFAVVETPFNAWAVPLFFFLMPIAWSPLIVAGTDFTAQLSDLPQGTAVGIFNGTTAVASLLGAFAAGSLADHFGYTSLPIAGLGFSILGAVLLAILVKSQERGHGSR